jgi:Methyltransferase domain
VDDTEDFERRIARLDTTLFAGVDGRSSEDDRTSWLALQRAVREAEPRFAYLEVGSYLGGSIQQYLLDPKCSRIYSIDKRPATVPGARDKAGRRKENSTENMVENLRAVAPGELHKLVCFDTDARHVDPALIVEAPDLCFIDGEHTDHAALSDFLFCLGVCTREATIYFHNESWIREGIRECLSYLKNENRPCNAYKLPGSTFAIAIGGSPVGSDQRVAEMALDGNAWLAGDTLIARSEVDLP